MQPPSPPVPTGPEASPQELVPTQKYLGTSNKAMPLRPHSETWTQPSSLQIVSKPWHYTTPDHFPFPTGAETGRMKKTETRKAAFLES